MEWENWRYEFSCGDSAVVNTPKPPKKVGDQHDCSLHGSVVIARVDPAPPRGSVPPHRPSPTGYSK